MDATTIGQRVSAGFGRAAAHLGVAGVQYRPSDALSPMGAVHATPMMAFDTPDFGFSKPAVWGVPSRYALLDTGDVRAGDILTCGTDDYFVARVEALRPPLCILCNRVVSVSGVAGTAGLVVAGCPASIGLKSRGESEGSGMPGSLRPGQFAMFLPLLPGVALLPYMTVTTDLGTSYTMNAVETSDFGFRCTISLQQV